MGVTGLDTHMGLERAHTPANSTGASAGSVEAGSGPRAATSASHSCEGSLKRSAEEAAAVALEAGAGEVSGGVARMVHGYASSSNLSASTEVEERVPVRSKRVRLMRLTGGATEACTGDSEAQPSCSASPLALEQRRWRSELAALSEPPPAAFVEVGAFERPQREVCGARQHYADIVCGVEFTADGRLLACAGVAKQVRVYAVGDLGDDLFADEAPQQPVAVHRLPQKMSSIAWCPDDEGIVTVGDYDGVVSQVHVASGHLVADVDEHDGRRVWSVAHSVQRRHLVASTSDDGTVRLWAGQGLRASAGVLRPAGGAPVCGAAFCSGDGNLLALAAADCRAYVYDLRATASPLAVLAAHTRPVSYARFLGRGEVVTASTDGSLALWDVAAAAAGGAPGARAGLSRTFRGHVNAKNFVGLAVCERERLLATGSETGAAVGYHTSWATPLAARAVVRARGPGAREFVSAIAWRPDSAGSRGPVLATALSNGDVRMLQLVAAA